MLNLEAGDVLYLYSKDITPPKNKYCACVHISPNLFLMINSENRTNYNCISLPKKNNSYLKYDSYISCNSFFQFDANALQNAQKVGKIDYNDLIRLKKHLEKNADSLPDEKKKLVLNALEDVLGDYI